MNASQRIEAAITKLEAARDEVVETGKLSTSTVQLALHMIPGVLRILRVDAHLIEVSTGEQLERVLSAAERSGDLALADAIIGEAA